MGNMKTIKTFTLLKNVRIITMGSAAKRCVVQLVTAATK